MMSNVRLAGLGRLENLLLTGEIFIIMWYRRPPSTTTDSVSVCRGAPKNFYVLSGGEDAAAAAVHG